MKIWNWNFLITVIFENSKTYQCFMSSSIFSQNLIFLSQICCNLVLNNTPLSFLSLGYIPVIYLKTMNPNYNMFFFVDEKFENMSIKVYPSNMYANQWNSRVRDRYYDSPLNRRRNLWFLHTLNRQIAQRFSSRMRRIIIRQLSMPQQKIICEVNIVVVII